MERTCARAVRIGLPALAFTEHFDPRGWSIDPQDLLGAVIVSAVAGLERRLDGVRSEAGDQGPAALVAETLRAATDLWWEHRVVLLASVELGVSLPEVYERNMAAIGDVGALTVSLLQGAAGVQGDLGPPIFYQVAFKGTAGDLADGAKVSLLGVKIGEVRDVKLVLPESGAPSTVATIVIFPAELNVVRSESTEADAWRRASDEALVKLLAQGYRATLVQSPPLIGSRSISLALDSQAKGGALITDDGGYPRIPSTGTTGDADQLMGQANDILAKINQIPIAGIGQQVEGFTAHLDQITASPEKSAEPATPSKNIKTVRLPSAPCASAINDKMPPSPLLSACIKKSTYLTVTVTISAQTISETTPMTWIGVRPSLTCDKQACRA